MKRKIKKLFNIKVFLILIVAIIVGINIQADDKELFMGFKVGTDEVKPNVVIMMDSSGSMNTIIFYPKKGIDGVEGTSDDGYDPTVSYSGSVEGLTSDPTYLTSTAWYARWVHDGNAYQYEQSELEGWSGKNFWTGCYGSDGTSNHFQVGSNGDLYFREGDKVLFRDTSSPYNSAVATLKRKYDDASGNPWFELSDIEGGPITVSGGHFQQAPDGRNWEAVVIQLYGTYDNSQQVRYPRDYIEWAFIHSSNFHHRAISHFSTYGTFDVNIIPDPVLSSCATPGNDDLAGTNPRIKQVFTRIQTAREVICKVATDSNAIVKLGLFSFNYDNGATLEEGLSDMSDEASDLVAYKNNVWGIYGNSWTPLAEALADIWYYYKPGPASKSYWPVDYEIAKGVNISVSNPVTPIEYWCQNNYVVLMTDGESTQDRFDSWTKYGDSIFKKKPVKRSTVWNSWDDGWGDYDSNESYGGYLPSGYNPSGTYCPNYTCWSTSNGSDLLDDVAYFLSHQDMFPDSHFGTDQDTGWPGDQNIYTYTIGFTADNDMLRETALNGNGAYYTANNYEELVEAFQLVITSINLRNFGFSALTAPRKTTTATNADQTISYVGYFMPSQAASLWEGHLLAFELIDKWGWDQNGVDGVEIGEYDYDTEKDCLMASGGATCERWIELSLGHEWDAANKMPATRNLFMLDDSLNRLAFVESNATIVQTQFLDSLTVEEVEDVIAKIKSPRLADVFHADVGFIGAPSYNKQYINNINPPGESDQTYLEFYEANKARPNVIYTGTNDGIFHMFYADKVNAGVEVWGLIPDEIIPSYKKMVLGNEHTYTVDGRIAANDIWYASGSGNNTWHTTMVFGLRRGGNAFYSLDVTTVDSNPDVMWKFKDDDFSGESWAEPIYGKIKIDTGTAEVDKWVIFLAGGFAYNSENPNDRRGKAVFVVDAATGDLLYMIGYDQTNGAALSGTVEGNLEVVDVSDSGDNKYLTKASYFNFCIPSSLSVLDKNNDGYTDAIYYGNVGGHLFKTVISKPNRAEWTTYILYKREYMANRGEDVIDSISDNVLTTVGKNFVVGDSIMGKTSYAYGYITAIDNKDHTVVTQHGTFVSGETIVARTYDPIYLSPALAYDTCYQLWITFGTGNRDRPRTDPYKGRFIALKDNNTTNIIETSGGVKSTTYLQEVTWDNPDEMSETTLSDSTNGFYFDLLDDGEKAFDPETIILPDSNFIPHIYFNSFQPPVEDNDPKTNPCNAPSEGTMKLYELVLNTCGTTETLSSTRTTGRIAGGGVYSGSKEYVLYTSESGNVGDVHGSGGGSGGSGFPVITIEFPYAGGILYWKEKKR